MITSPLKSGVRLCTLLLKEQSSQMKLLLILGSYLAPGDLKWSAASFNDANTMGVQALVMPVRFIC